MMMTMRRRRRRRRRRKRRSRRRRRRRTTTDRIRICEGTLALVRVQPCFCLNFFSPFIKYKDKSYSVRSRSLDNANNLLLDPGQSIPFSSRNAQHLQPLRLTLTFSLWKRCKTFVNSLLTNQSKHRISSLKNLILLPAKYSCAMTKTYVSKVQWSLICFHPIDGFSKKLSIISGFPL
jgi:hypothetical protein